MVNIYAWGTFYRHIKRHHIHILIKGKGNAKGRRDAAPLQFEVTWDTAVFILLHAGFQKIYKTPANFYTTLLFQAPTCSNFCDNAFIWLSVSCLNLFKASICDFKLATSAPISATLWKTKYKNKMLSKVQLDMTTEVNHWTNMGKDKHKIQGWNKTVKLSTIWT